MKKFLVIVDNQRGGTEMPAISRSSMRGDASRFFVGEIAGEEFIFHDEYPDRESAWDAVHAWNRLERESEIE